MKNSLHFYFSLVIFCLTTSVISAQPPGGGPGGRFGDRAMMNPEERAERQAGLMQDSLQLSNELTAEVKEVLTVYAKKMQDARAEANGDWESMRTTMQTLRKEQNEELQAILGEETWAKWEAMMADMRQGGPRGRGERQGREQGKKNGKKKDTRTE